jgi:lipopolysaccharide biosynthesis glycosyltransferase
VVAENKCFQIGLESQLKYSCKIETDFILHTFEREEKKIHYPHVNYDIMPNKFGLIYGLLEKYDRILFIDADVYIKKDSPDIFKTLTDDCIYMRNEATHYDDKNNYDKQIEKIRGPEWGKTNGHYDVYNAGVILIGKNQREAFNFNEREYVRWDEYPYISDNPYICWNIFNKKIPVKDCGIEWNAMQYFKQDGYFLHFANCNNRNSDIMEVLGL